MTAQADSRIPAWFQSRDASDGIALLAVYGVQGFEAYKGVAFVSQAVIGRIATALNGLVERNAVPNGMTEAAVATPPNVRRMWKQMTVFRRSLWDANATVRGMAAAAMIALDKDLTRHYNAVRSRGAVQPVTVATEPGVAEVAAVCHPVGNDASDIPPVHVRTVLAWQREKEALDRYFLRLSRGKGAAREKALPSFERWRELHTRLLLPFDRALTDFVT